MGKKTDQLLLMDDKYKNPNDNTEIIWLGN